MEVGLLVEVAGLLVAAVAGAPAVAAALEALEVEVSAVVALRVVGRVAVHFLCRMLFNSFTYSFL